MKLRTPAFEHKGPIPSRYTCDGDNINPALQVAGVPDGTVSLALIVDDPDAPQGTANPGWVHWVVHNIPPDTTEVGENTPIPGSAEGLNDSSNTGYMGPCPPSGTHRYVFKLYALNRELIFDHPPTKAEVEEEMKGHILDTAELLGTYSRAE